MRNLIAILMILISVNSFSQKKEIEELQDLLGSFKSEKEHYGVKNKKAYRLLSISKYDDVAIFYLLNSYQWAKQNDSIASFFNYLIKNNRNETEPYLIREQYNRYEKLDYSSRIKNLKEALKVDSNDTRVNYGIGKLYYDLFIREYSKNDSKANMDNYSFNSKFYFTATYKINSSFFKTLRFPLLQLSNYTKDYAEKEHCENYTIQNTFFPVTAFLVLPRNWEANYSINVMDYITGPDNKYRGTDYAVFRINWYSSHLQAMDEPILSDSLPTNVYRFTYLRTFDNPIVIGIENYNDSVKIYWKRTDGAGGYEPGKIIENNSKDLSIEDWKKVEAKIDSINFWSLPTLEIDLLGNDGSQWILEGKKLGRYHVVDRWCGSEIVPICKFLMGLTDLKIEEIY